MSTPFRVHMDLGVLSFDKVFASIRNPHGQVNHVDWRSTCHVSQRGSMLCTDPFCQSFSARHLRQSNPVARGKQCGVRWKGEAQVPERGQASHML